MADVRGVRGAHDALFRAVFAMPENAAALLRAALPAEIAVGLDLGRLESAPTDFVTQALGKRQVDKLYTVGLAASPWFAYVLLEHQSYADRFMVVRVLAYLAAIWDQHRRSHPRAKTVPQAVAVVVCHHRGRWPSAVRLADVLGPGPVAAAAGGRYQAAPEYVLCDLTAVSVDELATWPLTAAGRVTLWLLKITRGNRRLLSALRERRDWLEAELAAPGGREVFELQLTYIREVANAKHVSDSDLQDLADSLGQKAQEAHMTIAEQLRAEARAELLARQLRQKFGPLSQADAAAVDQALGAATVEQLDGIADRVLTALSLDEAIGSQGTRRGR